MTATTFRTDIGDGILAVLNAVKAAHPDLLRATSRARPTGYADLPCAYIENRPERAQHDSGTRTRTMSPAVVVVDRITDNAETMRRFDVLVDILVDAFTASPQFATGTMWDEFSVSDEAFDFGDYELAAVRFTFSDVTIMEGRV